MQTTKIEVRDLIPGKDAKGGRHGHRGHRHTSLLNQKEDPHAQTVATAFT